MLAGEGCFRLLELGPLADPGASGAFELPEATCKAPEENRRVK